MSEEKMFKYQNALDLFEEMYFEGEKKFPRKLDKSLNPQYYTPHQRIKESGRSIFSPIMFMEKDKGGKNHTYLGVEMQVERDRRGYDRILGNIIHTNSNNNIDITNQNKEEILQQVADILSMSNEEIMKKFGVAPYSYKTTVIGLLLADVIRDSIEGQGLQVQDCYFENLTSAIIMKLPEDKTVYMSGESYAFGMYRSPGISIHGKEGADYIYYEYEHGQSKSDEFDLDGIHINEIRIIDEHESVKTREGQIVVEKLKSLTRQKGEHTAEEIGEGISDLSYGEIGEALQNITNINEPSQHKGQIQE